MDCRKFLCSWNSPGKNTGGGFHFLLQEIFPSQGSKLILLYWQVDSSPLSHYPLQEPNPPPEVSSSVSGPSSWRILSPWAVSYNYLTFPKEWSCLDPSFSSLATSDGMWDLPPTRDGTHAPCNHWTTRYVLCTYLHLLSFLPKNCQHLPWSQTWIPLSSHCSFCF